MKLFHLTAALATLAIGAMALPAPAALPDADPETGNTLVARAEAAAQSEAYVDDGVIWPDWDDDYPRYRYRPYRRRRYPYYRRNRINYNYPRRYRNWLRNRVYYDDNGNPYVYDSDNFGY